MPKIYRAMEGDDGYPRVGSTARCLGVRVPTDGVRVPTDIEPDADGLVYCGERGMSVGPSVAALPTHRIPRRLKHIAWDAAGKDSDYVWSMGSGQFEDGNLCDSLSLCVDRPEHGVVRPAFTMLIDAYTEALSGTRALWRVDEE